MAIFASLQSFLLVLFSFATLMICICNKWISIHSKTKKNLPPSPRKLPIIGNFHQLGSNPNHALQKLSEKYGPLMLLHLGSMPTLVASSAEAAQEIMKTHDLSCCSRPNLTIPNILFCGCKSISFAPYGEYWRQIKNIVVVNLVSNKRVKSYQNVRQEEIGHAVRVLRESCGTTVDIGALFVSLTNNIICRVALGRTYGVKHTNLLREFMNMFTAVNVGSYIPWLSWVDLFIGSVRRAKKISNEFDEFVEGVIEEHVNKRKKKDAKSDEGKDFVDILLDVQNDNTTGFSLHRDSLKVILLEVFAAGTDTTYTSLEWAMSELVRNPRVMKKVQHEVTEIAQGRSRILEEDLEKMPYLKAVLKESLRLHTPAPLLIPRILTQDVKLMGYDIAEGTQVIINAWAIGRDPTTWEEPMEFRPERFLNSSISYQGFHFEWLPFGAGRRSCPGIQFSVPVIELALANIVYLFDLGLPNGIQNVDLDMSEAYGISTHRKSSLLVTVNPRF